MKLCVRKSDGAMFRPSFPDGWGDAEATASAFSGRGPQFYFRRIAVQPKRWWHRRERWSDTGETWEPESGEFQVVEREVVIARSQVNGQTAAAMGRSPA